MEKEQRIKFMKATTEQDTLDQYTLATSIVGFVAHDVPTRQAWLVSNPDIDFIVRDQGKLVGFINLLPVKHETIMRFMSGEIRGWDIPGEDVLPYTSGSSVECIVMGMGTTPKAEGENGPTMAEGLSVGWYASFKSWRQRMSRSQNSMPLAPHRQA